MDGVTAVCGSSRLGTVGPSSETGRRASTGTGGGGVPLLIVRPDNMLAAEGDAPEMDPLAEPLDDDELIESAFEPAFEPDRDPGTEPAVEPVGELFCKPVEELSGGPPAGTVSEPLRAGVTTVGAGAGSGAMFTVRARARSASSTTLKNGSSSTTSASDSHGPPAREI